MPQRLISPGICILKWTVLCSFTDKFTIPGFIQTCDFAYLGTDWIDWPMNTFFRSLLSEIYLTVCMH